MRVVRIGIAVLLAMILVLTLTNPSETAYLRRVSTDYGDIHHGMQMDPQMLRQVGESERRSFVLMSTYRYSFGTIAVDYFGVASIIVYLGSTQKHQPSGGRIANHLNLRILLQKHFLNARDSSLRV